MKSLDRLLDYTVVTIDGYYGQINDFLLDTKDWMVKYFKIDFGGILSSEFEMVSKEFVREFDHDKKEILLQITKKTIPGFESTQRQDNSVDFVERREETPELVNFQQIKGFRIVGKDGEIGTLEDFYIDNSWRIMYAAIDIPNGLPWSRLIPLEINMLKQFNYNAREIITSLNVKILNDAPSYSLSELEDKFNEKVLHDFYIEVNN